MSPGCITRILLTTILLALLAPSAAAMELGVRIHFGVRGGPVTDWSGTVRVEGGGEIVAWDGWRFEDDDRAGGGSFSIKTRGRTVRRSNRQKLPPGERGRSQDNGLLLSLSDVGPESRLLFETAAGDFVVDVAELAYGSRVERLEGRVRAERTGTWVPRTTSDGDDDYPEATLGPEGATYLTFTRFDPGRPRPARVKQLLVAPETYDEFAVAPGGDQVWLHVQAPGSARVEVAITDPGADVYRSSVAVDGDGRAWVFWSERRDGQFDVFARSWKGGALAPEQRLSSAIGSDLAPVATTASDGRIWVAWQGERDGVFRILARRQVGQRFEPEWPVSAQKRSCWSPSIASTSVQGGRIAIAWDSYEKGDYDIFYAAFDGGGNEIGRGPVANSREYEARVSVVYDGGGALWFGWEHAGESWGKDLGAQYLIRQKGLYHTRRVGLRVLLPDGEWRTPAGDIQGSLPSYLQRPGAGWKMFDGWESIDGQTVRRVPFTTLSRLATDRDGRVWALVRSRQHDFQTYVGEVWLDWAAHHDGEDWVGPTLLPRSDNFLYARPAVVAPPGGGLRLFYPTDHRLRRRPPKVRSTSDSTRWLVADEFSNDLVESRLEAPDEYRPSVLRPVSPVIEPSPGETAETKAERAAIARMRGYETTLRGEKLWLLRGEFHRHTEISGDGADDGPLEDMWRYAIDVADLDWIGNGDHDAGDGREYPWWLIQKSTDAFHRRGGFTSMFSYERSRDYPEGHRNVVFARRGVRVLPSLPLALVDDTEPARDTEMLYAYLRRFDGVSAPHTTATRMGTDWRNRASDVEPIVEIFQGARQSYERPGAPRAISKALPMGGLKPEGFVSEALKKGIKLGFVASSDHRSTHIAYANVYARERSREGILEALRSRRVYAATDNILADMRCRSGDREHFMGESFVVESPPDLRIRIVGTAPIDRVVLIKDDEVVQEWEPGEAAVDLRWIDPAPSHDRESYYYARAEQGRELVWLSPMWIRYRSDGEDPNGERGD